eukprot:SRR837773.5563.p2 GENE.SRR837773.5563~~SRR837773.5563.p2  ORF type:complete len:370 (+),score=151.16 SRR837773.5563:123-1112(+)
MAEKEAKDRERERKGREVYKRLEAKRDYEGTTNCIYWVIAGDLLGAMLIIWALTGTKWGSVTFTGTGVTNMHIETGMFDLDILILCGKNYFEDLLCKAAQRFAGQDSLNHFLGVACSIPGSMSCSEFQKIAHANTIILGTFAWNCVSLLISTVCAYFYWHNDHNPRWRKRAYAFGLAGPTCFLLSLAAWTVLMPDLTAMPRSWTAWGTVGGAQLIGYKAVQSPPYGQSFLIAIVGTLILLISNGLLPCHMAPHPSEVDDTDAYHERMELLDERLEFAKYGGEPTPYGGTAAPQGYPQGNPMMMGGAMGMGGDFGVYQQPGMMPMGGQMR